MGCDIHIYTEIKKANRWIPADRLRFSDSSTLMFENYRDYNILPHSPYYVPLEIYEGRNYELFALLAGVRGFLDPPIPPRGFPPDVSDEIQEIIDHYYEHTACWLSLKDLQSLKWYQVNASSLKYFFKQKGHGSRNTTMTKLKRLQTKHKVTADEVRIIFWFDS